MVRQLTLLLIILSGVFGLGQAKDKERAWQTGKLLDVKNEGFTTTGGSTTQGRVDDYGNVSATTTQTKWNHERWTYVVDEGKYIYVLSHVLSWRWSKECKLTVNGPVRFAIEKDKFYILDEDNKEHKLKIKKKILKEVKDDKQPQ